MTSKDLERLGQSERIFQLLHARDATEFAGLLHLRDVQHLRGTEDSLLVVEVLNLSRSIPADLHALGIQHGQSDDITGIIAQHEDEGVPIEQQRHHDLHQMVLAGHASVRAFNPERLGTERTPVTINADERIHGKCRDGIHVDTYARVDGGQFQR